MNLKIFVLHYCCYMSHCCRGTQKEVDKIGSTSQLSVRPNSESLKISGKIFRITLYNVCSVHRGGGGGVFSTLGDTMSHRGDTMSTSGRYHEYIGGIS